MNGSVRCDSSTVVQKMSTKPKGLEMFVKFRVTRVGATYIYQYSTRVRKEITVPTVYRQKWHHKLMKPAIAAPV